MQYAPLVMDPLSSGADEVVGELGRQALVAAVLGSPFVCKVLIAADRAMPLAPQCARIFAEWPGDRAADALAMRFNAALHALARSGEDPELSRLYVLGEGDFDGIIARAMAGHDADLALWLAQPTQTNEIARSAATLAALKVLTGRFAMPVELMELGASAGLNLNLAHYHYRLGTHECGPVHSPVRIEPMWQGDAPPDLRPVVLRARGVDLAPLDLTCQATVERLHAFVWADRAERRKHLYQALTLARIHPPQVEQGNAAPWLAAQLDLPAVSGVCRVVVHSMMVQYLGPAGRAELDAVFDRAYARATPSAPVARIGFEWTPARDEVRLTLTVATGRGVEEHVLATCHPYGDWIDWRGEMPRLL